jgi:phage tail sheath gpL-like
MATITIQIKTSRDYTDYVRSAQGRANGAKAAMLLKSIADGTDLGQAYIGSASADPVAAASTVTITYGSAANADTVTVAGQVLTCVTGTPSTAEFKKETDATKTATNMAAAVNAHATLSKHFTATSALGVVTITAKVKGSLGNLLAVTTSNGTGFGVVSFTGGTGGVEGSVITVR